MKERPPLLLALEVDEILRIEKSGSVGSIIRTPVWLTTCVTSGNEAMTRPSFVSEVYARCGTSLGGNVSTHPDRTFIEVRQEF